MSKLVGFKIILVFTSIFRSYPYIINFKITKLKNLQIRFGYPNPI